MIDTGEIAGELAETMDRASREHQTRAENNMKIMGTIGFIGLVGPHIARLLLGEDHRFLLPAAMLTGALIMSLASVASKLLVPGTLLPVGIVTSMIGVPVFLALILRRPERA